MISLCTNVLHGTISYEYVIVLWHSLSPFFAVAFGRLAELLGRSQLQGYRLPMPVMYWAFEIFLFPD